MEIPLRQFGHRPKGFPGRVPEREGESPDEGKEGFQLSLFQTFAVLAEIAAGKNDPEQPRGIYGSVGRKRLFRYLQIGLKEGAQQMVPLLQACRFDELPKRLPVIFSLQHPVRLRDVADLPQADPDPDRA